MALLEGMSVRNTIARFLTRIASKLRVSQRRKKRSLEELRKASNHLNYEIGMLLQLRSYLSREISDVIFRNACVESWLVHARNLLDFFYSRNPRLNNNDEIAEDFFRNQEEWCEVRPKRFKKDSIKKVKSRIAKEIVHMSYQRAKVTSKEWKLDMTDEINTVIDKFLELVPEELLGEEEKFGISIKERKKNLVKISRQSVV